MSENEYQTVSLKKDTDIKELEAIAADLGIESKPPAVIRALINRYKKEKEAVDGQ